jgi:hypothetical protein
MSQFLNVSLIVPVETVSNIQCRQQQIHASVLLGVVPGTHGL